MDVVHPRCAGIDISKKDAKVCVRIQGRGSQPTSATVTTWGAMTNQILAVREYLVQQQVTCVVMEATSDYWKPYFYLLEEGVTVMLVNAHDARNVPGRKTDVSDATWLARSISVRLVRAVPRPTCKAAAGHRHSLHRPSRSQRRCPCASRPRRAGNSSYISCALRACRGVSCEGADRHPLRRWR